MAIYFDNSNIITGSRGPQGPQGIQGPIGPNEISATTATNISSILKGNGSTVQAAQAGTDYQAPLTAGVDYASPAILRTVTLGVAAWTGTEASFTQTVTVSGVLADETKQAIYVSPASGYGTMYGSAGIECTVQGENSLTFSCETVPESDITVNISIQGATV